MQTPQQPPAGNTSSCHSGQTPYMDFQRLSSVALQDASNLTYRAHRCHNIINQGESTGLRTWP